MMDMPPMRSAERKENISVSIPEKLLSILDMYVRELDLDRSQIVTRAVRLYLATKIAKSNPFWEKVYQEFAETGKIQEL